MTIHREPADDHTLTRREVLAARGYPDPTAQPAEPTDEETPR